MRKAEKRALGEARQKQYREASIQSGLKAQQRDREARTRRTKLNDATLAAKKTSAAMRKLSEATAKTAKTLGDNLPAKS